MAEQSEQLAEVLAEARESNRLSRLAREQIEACSETQNQKLEQALSNALVFPEILTPSHTLAISTAVGQVTVDPGQQWLHRGWKIYSSDDYELAQRQFATQAGKNYHLRWSPADGFSLKDVADLVYNPNSLIYDAENFDTIYDDMIVARILTNSNNSATFKKMVNKDVLTGSIIGNRRSYSGGAEADHNYYFDLAWARKPKINISALIPPGNRRDSDYHLKPLSVSREKIHIYSWTWQLNYPSQSLGFTMNLSA